MTKLLTLCAVLGLLMTACGGGDSDEGDAATEAPSTNQAAESPDPDDAGAAGQPSSESAGGDPQPTDGTVADQAPDASPSPETSDDPDGETADTSDPTGETADPAAEQPETPDPAAEQPETPDPIFQPTCGGEGELGATATGVTADTIKIGAPQVDYEELGNLGLAQIKRGSFDVVLQALAEELNENGGICGRMVESVTFDFLPFGTDTSLAGCVYFTEDENVFAVLGGFGRVSAGNFCVAETHSTALFGAPFTAEDLARANAPWVNLQIASDRSLEVFVTVLDRVGLLADVGNVAVHSDAQRQARVDNVLVPALESAGVNIVERTVLDVPPGDTQAAASVWRTFLEIYRNAGVDSVFLEGDTLAIGQLIQGGLNVDLFTTDVTPVSFSLRETGDPGYFDAYALGGPFVAGEYNQRMKDCIDTFERRSGIDVVQSSEVPEDETDWHSPVVGLCPRFDLFVQVAAAAGPNLSNETLQAAIDGFGSIELPGEAFASLGPGKYDARDGVVLLRWDPEAENGTGGFVAASELIDTAN